MLNTITQIFLGIVYGIYLAFFAPASQRQKAYDLLKQTKVPTFQEEPMYSQVEVAVVKLTGQQDTTISKVLEDPWLANPTPILAKSQENPAAIFFTSTAPALLLPPARLSPKQPSVIRSATKQKANKTKQVQLAAKESTSAKRTPTMEHHFNKLTAEELRKECSNKGIHWRNARGSGKHMVKAQMLERLLAA